jgi:hypothetical protein
VIQEGFLIFFGEDKNDIGRWKRLCWAVGLSHRRHTMQEGKAADQCLLPMLMVLFQALRGFFVNLVYLVDAAKAEKTVKTFKLRGALIKYIARTETYFPLSETKEGSVLKLKVQGLSCYHTCNDRQSASSVELKPPASDT